MAHGIKMELTKYKLLTGYHLFSSHSTSVVEKRSKAGYSFDVNNSFKRCGFYGLLTLLLILVNGCSSIFSQTNHPNVIVILSDDQGWGDFSFQGNTNLETPHIDQLVEEGALFERFYVSPVCSPTRAEFLTGKYHPRSGIHGTSEGEELLSSDQTTIAEVFQRAGYATALFGKWHNGSQFPYHPLARGFEEFYGFTSGHWGNYFNPWLEHNGNIVKGEGYITDDYTNHAIDFITKNKENPFFLFLAYNTPHAPMQVPDRWWDTHEGQALTLFAENRIDEDTMFTKAALAMCENIDWNVGRILDALDNIAISDNTIILYFTDNGPNSWRWNGELKGRKGSTDEGGVRSPLIMRWPRKIQAGRKINEVAAAIDLMPTLAELASIEMTEVEPMYGVSLKPLLLNSSETWPHRYIFSHWKDRSSVRDQRWMVDHQGHLFDLERDPGQKEDVSLQFPKVTSELRAAIEKWISEVIPVQYPSPVYFPVGHPSVGWTYLPARDAHPHGNIHRSNRWPNCSFLRGWTSTEDSITWNIEVLKQGNYRVDLYYTCEKENTGAKIGISFRDRSIYTTVDEAFDPLLKGMEDDRVPRKESYVKDFRMKAIGSLPLTKGKGILSMKAVKIPGEEAIDVRLLKLTRVE